MDEILPFENLSENLDLKKADLKKLNKKVEDLQAENKRLREEITELSYDMEEAEKLRPDKTFGLNVTGDVMLNKMEVEILNSPHFQRLGYLNQLGSTNTVYRSANHTRFEHSLGVLKIANIMIERIMNNKHSIPDERNITLEEQQIIRLLALLHDIGHMPFGHTIEDEFNVYPSHDKHESRWDYFLGKNSIIGKIIIKYNGEDFHKRFYRLVKCEKNFKGFEQDAFMYDIVSNTVCADLLDYLQRDCQYTNLKLNFHPRFLDYLIIKSVENEKTKKTERRIVIRLCKTRNKEPRKDIQSELVQLIRNRYYLGERVYYHHTKIKTGALIAGAVLRAKQANGLKIIDGSKPKRSFTEVDAPIYDINVWGDVELIMNLKNIPSNKSDKNSKLLESASYLAENYLKRTIYYQLHSYSKADLGLNQSTIDEIIENKIDINRTDIFEVKLVNDFGNAITRLTLEDQICDLLPDMKSGDFLIYFPNYKMQMKMAKVLIEDDDEIVRQLRECKDPIIRQECKEIIEKHQNIWQLRVLINPKFVSPRSEDEKTIYREKYGKDFDQDYKNYVRIIEKYCKWIFARNNSDSMEFSEEFWGDILNYLVDTELDTDTNKESNEVYNPNRNSNGRKNRHTIISEMANDFAHETNAYRTKVEIIGILRNKFKENSNR